MKKSIFLVMFVLIACYIHAEESKIDTLLDISKKTGRQVNELYEQHKNDPLAGKTWGAEFNFRTPDLIKSNKNVISYTTVSYV